MSLFCTPRNSILMALAFAAGFVPATTDKYRLTWRTDPSTTMVIGWNQVNGNNAVVYYDTADRGTDTSAYAFRQGVSASNSHMGMTNTFARLSNLQPDTAYYFVVADSNSTSQRMWFRTAPADASSFTVIAGGDSRNNWETRIDANKMVAKLRPLFVMFGGDMTAGDSPAEWQAWMDHWQKTRAPDGRMFPIIAARGNHEKSNASVSRLFDSPDNNVYYALTFGDKLLRTYTLNSEITEGGDQASWLESDLRSHQDVTWRFAQYHKPMRPHVSRKSEGDSEYNAWAKLFHTYRVQLVVECDSHMVKRTWPVRPSTGSGNDQGFIRDDDNGTIYVGEGTWGAPLRTNNDSKDWTRDSGSFNQFKWIQVSRTRVKLRTVRYGNVDQVGTVNDTQPWIAPANLDLWSPANGTTIVISDLAQPRISIKEPADGAFIDSDTTLNITADASLAEGNVTRVDFYADGNWIGRDTAAPFSFDWDPSDSGTYVLTAIATGGNGETNEDQVRIQVGVGTILVRVADGNDDAEQRSDNTMYLDSSDLELVRDGADQTVGIRFRELLIPRGMEIVDAAIRFTVDDTTSENTHLSIHGQNAGDAEVFTSDAHNISDRPVTVAFVNWNPAAWNRVGASGSAQATPDLSAIVQEIVNRSDWSSGNDMVFIITGSGRRVAESYNGVSSSAPLLTITYRNPP